MRHDSVALNMDVEFINVTPVNPLISSCDIKVLYHGKNRNKSYITKAVANEMAKSLPNIPIVGEYLEEIEDFGDHGQEMVINSKGVKFIKRTVPFGVVPSDTNIWWQKFLDDDGVEREYMLCKGYLWTGRYPQTTRIIEKGNGQSMELDGNFMSGDWAKLDNEEEEYFIINEAIFSALCILGEDVEPCFEGANIVAPSAIYSLDKDDFKTQMNDFMLELRTALNDKGGEEKMELENLQNDGQTDVVENAPVVNPIEEPTEDHAASIDEDIQSEEVPVEEVPVVVEEPVTEEAPVVEEPTVEEEPVKEESYNLDEIEEYQTLKAEYATLEEKYNSLLSEKEGMETELHSLRDVKLTVDRQAKNELIGKFYMLEEEDLADIKQNIDTYSLEEIESKLSITAFRKKVNFNLDTTETNQEDDIIAFSVQADENVPAWVKAIEKVRNNNR